MGTWSQDLQGNEGRAGSQVSGLSPDPLGDGLVDERHVVPSIAL
jgi:hypothetical protein